MVDWKNTSGFGKDGQAPLVAIFTHHLMEGEKAGRSDFQYQSIAYSNDKGRTWTKYQGNPVIPNTEKIRDFRDPKVIWDEAREQWLMVFAVKTHDQFWASKDLKNWTHLSNWGKEWGRHGDGPWECPDFFPMIVEGFNEQKWVLLQSINPDAYNGGSGTQYFVGDWDGSNFILDKSFEKLVSDNQGVWIDYGRDNYAGVTWSDIPKADGRRLFIGWMSNWDYANVVPTTVWRSAMTLPRTLSLKKIDNQYRLFSQPIEELEKLRGQSISLEKTEVTQTLSLTNQYRFKPKQCELIIEYDLGKTTSPLFGIELSNERGESYRLGFNAAQQQFFSDRTQAGDYSFSEKFASNVHLAPRLIDNTTLKMHIFLDAASAELFADNGATVLTDIFFPTQAFNQLTLFAEDGVATLTKGTIYSLKRIWD